uniref:Uncharacterized protein n=1 Tax=Percolomonas cosmopolitus TaxID=63605 RepID=A0A7S1PGX3_9EUKA
MPIMLKHLTVFILAILLFLSFPNRSDQSLPHTNTFFFGLNGFAQGTQKSNIFTSHQEKKVIDESGAGQGKTIAMLSTGLHHVLVAMSDGTLYSYGSNERGQLGRSLPNSLTFTGEVSPVTGLTERVESMHAKGAKSAVLTQVENYIYEFGDSLSEEASGKGYTTKPVRIIAHNLLPMERFLSVHCTPSAAFAVTDNNRIFSFGMNDNFELGDNTVTQRKDAEPLQQVFDSGVETLATGTHFVVLLEKNGKLWQWGRLMAPGGSSSLYFEVPTQVTTGDIVGHALKLIALSEHLLVYVTTSNEVYHTSNNVQSNRVIVPQDFTSESTVITSLTCSWDGTCSVRNSAGSVYVWLSHPQPSAFQNYGQLSPFSNCDNSLHKQVKQVAHLNRATLFVSQDSLTVSGVGENTHDLLGVKTVFTSLLPEQLFVEQREDSSKILEFDRIGSGHQHTLLLNTENTLYSLGFNSFGALGDTYNLLERYPHEIDTEAYCGTGRGSIKHVAAGKKHSLLLNGDNQVFAFGDSTAAFGVDHIPFGSCHNMNFTEPILEICAGAEYSMALTEERTSIYLWGHDPNTGALKPPTKLSFPQFQDGIKQIYCGGNHHFALLNSGELYCWGSNARGACAQRGKAPSVISSPRLVDIPTPNDSEIEQIVAGAHHSLVLNSNGDVYAFGDNSFYQINTSERKILDDVYFVVNVDKYSVTNLATTEKLSIVAVDADNGQHGVFVWGTTTTETQNAKKIELQRVQDPCSLTSLVDIVQSHEGAYIVCETYLTHPHPPFWKVSVVLVGVMGGLATVTLGFCVVVGCVRCAASLFLGPGSGPKVPIELSPTHYSDHYVHISNGNHSKDSFILQTSAATVSDVESCQDQTAWNSDEVDSAGP